MAKIFAITFAVVSLVTLLLLMRTVTQKEIISQLRQVESQKYQNYYILLLDLVKKSDPNELKKSLKVLFPRDELMQNKNSMQIADICLKLEDQKITGFCTK